MHKLINKLIVIMALCAFCSSGNAQTVSSLNLKDISLSPDSIIDSAQDTFALSYNLFFKIDSAALANHVFIQFGTEQNSGNILNISAPVTHQSDGDYIVYREQSLIVRNYTARVPITITNIQYANLNYITIYVEDLDHNLTTKYYYSINQ